MKLIEGKYNFAEWTFLGHAEIRAIEAIIRQSVEAAATADEPAPPNVWLSMRKDGVRLTIGVPDMSGSDALWWDATIAEIIPEPGEFDPEDLLAFAEALEDAARQMRALAA